MKTLYHMLPTSKSQMFSRSVTLMKTTQYSARQQHSNSLSLTTLPADRKLQHSSPFCTLLCLWRWLNMEKPTALSCSFVLLFGMSFEVFRTKETLARIGGRIFLIHMNNVWICAIVCNTLLSHYLHERTFLEWFKRKSVLKKPLCLDVLSFEIM